MSYKGLATGLATPVARNAVYTAQWPQTLISHFTIYIADQKRFVVPLSYLENDIIRQLLSMSEEEFGLPSNGPITLPCDAVFMDYIISLLSQGLSRELENALLVSVTSHRCSSAPLLRNQELLVCSY
ncbi:PREDICTED: auxin-responsive protein SAUR67-like [Ipomoea nil]|uniref:auxin-responsive protein SAUR67-like n=1 Tax=Ipomoea nil TaxID=35883 RepID=UPI0009019389|nr:PREDICTED: auxin-responsive protein SAUR67-like [Ipomoea nil]